MYVATGDDTGVSHPNPLTHNNQRHTIHFSANFITST